MFLGGGRKLEIQKKVWNPEKSLTQRKAQILIGYPETVKNSNPRKLLCAQDETY